MKIEFDIQKIVIIKGFGADCILLETNHPNPYNKEFCDAPLSLEFKATENTGEKYVKENFPGIPVVVVERPEHKSNFSKKD